ncbi:MAG TPA: DUF4389 domain-containing protein [Trebonia sp.]
MNEVTVTAYPPPYQPYPGPAPVLAAPPPILVAVADPVPQRRATVAFRILLAVPHLFILYFLSIAAGAVAFVGWWAALFTGRLPQFAVDFLSGFLRWTTRVYAYDLLLTDVYPPFGLDDAPSYPVRVAIPEPQRLHRAAVFFRYFLAFPATLLAAILIYGAGTLLALVAWLITLVTGRLPGSLHLAYVAVLRFETRLYGYWWMLTPAYPGGLYGDQPGATAWADALPAAPVPGPWQPGPGFGKPGPADGTPQGYGTPPGYGSPQRYDANQGYGPAQGYGSPQAYGWPQGYDAAPGYGAPPAYGTPAGYGTPGPGYGIPPAPGYGPPAPYGAPGGYGVRPVFQPATWLLPLTSGARKLVTTFIVLGSLFLAGYLALYAVLIGSTVGRVDRTVTTISQLNGYHHTLVTTSEALDKAAKACGQELACVTKVDGQYAGAFQTFSDQLARTSVPASANQDMIRLSTDSSALAEDYLQLSQATTAAQYQSALDSNGVQDKLSGFNQDYPAVITDLEQTMTIRTATGSQ